MSEFDWMLFLRVLLCVAIALASIIAVCAWMEARRVKRDLKRMQAGIDFRRLENKRGGRK